MNTSITNAEQIDSKYTERDRENKQEHGIKEAKHWLTKTMIVIKEEERQ